jgi:predicted secreted hydrolase
MNRRRLLLMSALASAAPSGVQADAPARRFAQVVPRALRFPQDHGAHPEYRTEWWYATGWLTRPGGPDFGFQVTFFRSATGYPAENPSRFAPRQLLLAHAALALPERGRLLHAERSARAMPPLARFAEEDTDIQVGTGTRGWSLRRDPATDTYHAHIESVDLALELSLKAPDSPLLQGEAGFSRKGPESHQASHYYSRPQLQVSGQVRLQSNQRMAVAVRGTAWFDHEWSSEILGENAVGWDWIGINLDDGGALMAFCIRDAQGRRLWHEASLRDGTTGRVRTGLPVTFEPVRHWQSVRSGARWPIAQRLTIDQQTYEIEPLLEDQELAMRGVTYWEGAVTLSRAGRRIGRGYLELTGYAGRVRL